jgi:hypothetical protein
MTFLMLLTGAVAVGDLPPAPPPPTAQQVLMRWMPGEVRCGGGVLAGARALRPHTSLSWSSVIRVPMSYRFRIDEAGRPLSIAREAQVWVDGAEDVAPSLAASRFAPGAARDCTITYTAEPLPIPTVPVADLISYSVTPLNGPLPDAGWDRVRPEGGDCNREPRAQWLIATSPDYERLPAPPGVRDWTLVGYDQDARGHAVEPHVLSGTRNVALDKAGIRAIAASRWTGGRRRGCLNPYLRQATRLAPPANVDLDTLRPADANCTGDADWAEQPRLNYPEPWRRRAVEGWAIIAYDVAPWGATGNIRVLRAEPADEFGTAAASILSHARRAASATGHVGCVERVVQDGAGYVRGRTS